MFFFELRRRGVKFTLDIIGKSSSFPGMVHTLRTGLGKKDKSPAMAAFLRFINGGHHSLVAHTKRGTEVIIHRSPEFEFTDANTTLESDCGNCVGGLCLPKEDQKTVEVLAPWFEQVYLKRFGTDGSASEVKIAIPECGCRNGEPSSVLGDPKGMRSTVHRY